MWITEQFVDHGDWSLHLRRTASDDHLVADSRPLVIVPGYGMNSFIFGYHPKGTSLERSLAASGFEVWSLNMRGQRPSHAKVRRPEPASIMAYAASDLVRGIEVILDQTATNADRVDVLGASLGGSIAYAHLALLADEHQVGSLVTIGSPLRWEQVHPLVRVAFGSERLASRLRFSGTQRLARVALPVLARTPLMSLYMNVDHIDLRHAGQLVRTVDDPQPGVNRDIARWIKNGDLVFDELNVTDALADVDVPLLVVLANRDGIVPPSSALAAIDAWGSDASVLEIGTDADWYAHADLFVGHDAEAVVFDPIAKWLRDRWEGT